MIPLDFYFDLGFDTLPLKPGTKIAAVSGWQRRDSWRMWRSAPQYANVGVRTGGGLAVLDCDDKKRLGTFDMAIAWLAGLGYLPDEYPVVQTASGVGRHIYLSFTSELSGDYRLLSRDFGEGEFRFGKGAYVVAPPSVVTDSGTYKLIGGDFRQMPRLSLADIRPILSNCEIIPDNKQPTISRRAWELLRGIGIDKYPSRSEAERALIIALVNTDHDFNSVLSLFLHHPCAGKFNELRANTSESNAVRWLKHTYDEAARWATTHESKERRIVLSLQRWAESSPWPGRTGSYDRVVYIAHTSIAHKAGRLEYAASCRDLAEAAEVSAPTANAASKRLCALGLLSLSKPATLDCANTYRLLPGTDFNTPSSTSVQGVVKFDQPVDIFRTRGLGKAAGEVYKFLQRGPATVKTLAEATGRSTKTIKRALKRMVNIVDTVTGELIPMVEECDGEWRPVDVDFEQVAQIVGTAGAGERQKVQHMKERRLHRRSLELGRRQQDSS